MIHDNDELPMKPLTIEYCEDDPYGDITIKCEHATIARLMLDDAPVHDFNSRQRKFARLFAVAPDLLEVCKTLISLVEYNLPETHPGPCGPESNCDMLCMELAAMSSAVELARTIIAKAKQG